MHGVGAHPGSGGWHSSDSSNLLRMRKVRRSVAPMRKKGVRRRQRGRKGPGDETHRRKGRWHRGC
jgi:hypothetical protein